MLKQKVTRLELWICGLFLCIGALAYSSLYLNNVYPFTEGWGIYYVELIKQGQVPYRDFYFYLPPLTLLVDWMFWSLSFGSMFAFKCWYILQRIVMLLMLYKLLTKWIAPSFAWIACLTGLCVYTAVVWDLGGDYNQTQTLLVLLLIYSIVWFFEKDADSKQNGIIRYRYIALAGCILALTVLLKQSLGVATIIMSLLFLVTYCIVFHDRRFIRYCLATAAGASIPFGIFIVYLIANRALLPFLEQFFGVANAKGSLDAILFQGWNTLFSNSHQILLYTSTLTVLWALVQYANRAISARAFATHIIATFFAFKLCYRSTIDFVSRLACEYTTIQVLIAMIILIFVVLSREQPPRILAPLTKANHLGITAILYTGTFLFFRFNVNGLTTKLYDFSPIFYNIPEFITYFTLYSSIILVVAGFVHYANKTDDLYPRPVLFVLIGGIADAYANIMSAVDTIYPKTLFILAPVIIGMIFSYKLPRWNKAKNLTICILCVMTCGICMTQKYTTAYSWWGSEATYPLHERIHSIDVNGLEGFRVAKQRKIEYEEIVKIIENNSDANDTVWGFPHIKIFNILTDHYNVEDPVPVLFYDVCPDDAAMREYEWLKDNNPDFVIWCDMPDCIEVHERIFRADEATLGQRAIVDWFSSVKDTAYIKVGQAGNLFVYQLDNGDPIHYTYFQDPDAINITAGEQ